MQRISLLSILTTLNACALHVFNVREERRRDCGRDLSGCYWGFLSKVEDVGLSVTPEGNASVARDLLRNDSRW